MRRMSFSITTDQFRNRTKTVTRRLGWAHAKAGDQIMGIEKGMGLKLGEKQVELGTIELVDVRRERLDAIDQADVDAEGFPELDPAGFIAMFLRANPRTKGSGGRTVRTTPATLVTRLEYRYLDSEDAEAALAETERDPGLARLRELAKEEGLL